MKSQEQKKRKRKKKRKYQKEQKKNNSLKGNKVWKIIAIYRFKVLLLYYTWLVYMRVSGVHVCILSEPRSKDSEKSLECKKKKKKKGNKKNKKKRINNYIICSLC